MVFTSIGGSPNRPLGETEAQFLSRITSSGAAAPLLDVRQQYLDKLSQLEAANPATLDEPPQMKNGFGLCSRASSTAGHLDYGIRHDHKVFWGFPDAATMRRRAVLAYRNVMRRPIIYGNAPYRSGSDYTTCGRPYKYYTPNTSGGLDYHEFWSGPPYVDGTVASSPAAILDNGNASDGNYFGNQMDHLGCWWSGYDLAHLPIGIGISLAEMGLPGRPADWQVPYHGGGSMASDLGKECVFFNSYQAAGVVRRYYLPIPGVSVTAEVLEPGAPRFMAKYARLTARAGKLGVLQQSGSTAADSDLQAFVDYMVNVALPYCEKTLATPPTPSLGFPNALGIRSSGQWGLPHQGFFGNVVYPVNANGLGLAGHAQGLFPWPKMGWHMVQMNEVAEVVQYWPEAADMLVAFGGAAVAVGNRMRDVVRRYANVLTDATNSVIAGVNTTVGEVPYQLSFSPAAWATLAASPTPLQALTGLVENVDYMRHWSAYSALSVVWAEWKRWCYTAFRIRQNYPPGAIPDTGQIAKSQVIADGILAWWQALPQQFEEWNGGSSSFGPPQGQFQFYTFNNYHFMVEYGTAGFAGATDGPYSTHPNPAYSPV